MAKKKRCFIIGPIGEEDSEIREWSDWVKDGIVTPALDPLGYSVLRADQDDRPGQITTQVIENIKKADLIVVDLTGHNPNVMYELGIAHMWMKPVIPIARDGTPIPFDIYESRTIKFRTTNHLSTERAKRRLAEYAKATQEADFKVSNPVTQAVGFMELESSGDSNAQILAGLVQGIENLHSRIAELEVERQSSARRTELVNVLMHGRDTKQGGYVAQPFSFSFPAGGELTEFDKLFADAVEKEKQAKPESPTKGKKEARRLNARAAVCGVCQGRINETKGGDHEADSGRDTTTHHAHRHCGLQGETDRSCCRTCGDGIRLADSQTINSCRT